MDVTASLSELKPLLTVVSNYIFGVEQCNLSGFERQVFYSELLIANHSNSVEHAVF